LWVARSWNRSAPASYSKIAQPAPPASWLAREDDRVEHHLDVERRAHGPADLAQRGQLLDRLRQLARTGLQLREEPNVLHGDDGLVGEGLQQLDLALGERPGLGSDHHYDADGSTLPQHRYVEAASKADRTGERLMLELRIQRDIGDVDHRALQDGPRGQEGPAERRRIYAVCRFEGLRSVVVLGDMMDLLAVEPKERAEEPVAQSHRAPDDRVEDRLDVGLRPADHAQDLRRRRLLLERLADLCVPLLQLGEEPHILDGDDRLVGEGLQQRPLGARETTRLSARHHDGSHRLSIVQHGYGEQASDPEYSPGIS
jgi:hypothetical protein